MKCFGTDGIRSRANEWPLVPEFLVKIGRAIPRSINNDSNVVILGGDTRQSTGMISTALVSGILAAGCNVVIANIIPTPILAFFTRELKAKCGLVVTASHNPWDDNGIKFFTHEGFKLSDDDEQAIESLLDKEMPDQTETGCIHNLLGWEEAYLQHLKSLFNIDLSGLKLVLDLANGATLEIAPKVFKAFGANPIIINNSPNGKNINLHCGATDAKGLSEEVKKQKADLGIAFDGDGDRVILVNEQGHVVDGDAMMAIIALDMHSKGKLNKDTVAITPYSNWGLRVFLWERGIKVDYAKTGDRYVSELMRNHDYRLGGEKSGHIILSDYETTGNGIITALKLLEIMVATGKPLSKLNTLHEFPQVLVNVKVSKKTPFDRLPRVKASIKSVEEKLGRNGRVFVRYSGTQDLARIMVEGVSEELITEYANRIAEAIRSELG